MAWWIKVSLVGLIGVFCIFDLGLGPSAAMAVRASESLASERQLSTVQSHFQGVDDGRDNDRYDDSSRDDSVATFTIIAPELTNPPETPVAETQPESVSPLTRFSEGLAITESAELDPDSVDATVKQWLSSVKALFESE